MAERDLTQGPVALVLARLTAPMLFGVLSVMSIALTDAIYLARAGEAALAASGFTYPITVAAASFGIGLSAGASSVISRALGAGERDRAARLSAHAMGFSLALGVGLAAAMVALGDALFAAMGAKGEVAEEVAGYNFWWALSLPAVLLSMTMTAAVRSYGDTLAPSVLLVLIAAINIVIGPVFIFGWFGIEPMNAEGAGLATFIARMAGVAVAGAYLVWRGFVTKASLSLKGARGSLTEIAGIAGPAAGSNAINPVGMAIVTAAVAVVGESAVAGFGAATRIQAFAVVPLLALSSAIGPMVGQNWGADERDRVEGAMAASTVFILAWSAVVAIAFLGFAGPLAALATPEGAAQDYAAQYLRIVGLSIAGYGLTFVGNAALNARGKPMLGLGVSVLRAFVIYAGGAWALVGAFGYSGVLAAAVLANLVAAIAAAAAAARAEIAPPLSPHRWRIA